jgi:Asp-tRNA(Asn)/Glu-tRNA(Gln) amidotransferase A subunit family amidase
VLRPASYCGVVGFKPSFGLLPTTGLLPFAPSLDTAGLFTQTAEDMRLLWERTWGGPPVRPSPAVLAAVLPEVEPPMRQAFQDTLARLRAAGAQVDEIDLPAGYDRLVQASRLVNSFEGARTHRACWEQHGERMGYKLAQLIADGLRIPEDEYEAARAHISQMQGTVDQLFRQYSVILTPAAPGHPPPADSTGDPRLNAAWTALGTPAIAVPMPTAGLPLGLQLTAARGQDNFLVAVAAVLEPSLR